MPVTPADVRRVALDLPEAVESAHMGHPDFRIGGKIFATLWPDKGLAVVKLTPDQQQMFVEAEPAIFHPVPGGWGRHGATNIVLELADGPTLRSAFRTAWRNRAPKRLVDAADDP